jgi:hydrogenase maturation protease
VIGVGNPYRRDDAAGLEVARRVAAAALPAVLVHEHDGEPTGLLDLWDGMDAAYLVDMVVSGAPPGTVHWFDATVLDVPVERGHSSTHHLSLREAVGLARALDRMPGRLLLVGIEGRDVRAGTAMHAAVEAGVEHAVRRVRDQLPGSTASTVECT